MLARPHFSARRLLAALSLAAVALVPASAALLAPVSASGAQSRAASEAGYVYEFRIHSDDDSPILGRATVLGDRERIEFTGGDRAGTYLLLTDGGRTLMAVDPDKREYSTMHADDFERIVGTAMAAVDKVMTLEVHDLRVGGQRLGDGGTIAGHATQHGRLVQDYTVKIGVLGFTENTRHHVVTDYWVTDEVQLPRNPLFGLFASLPTVLAQNDGDFVKRAEAGRKALVGSGTPLRVVVESTSQKKDGAEQSRTAVEITSLSRATPSAALFAVPSGYRQKADFNWSVNGGHVRTGRNR